ncbi:sensor histidine kinase [Conexibacter stalactiti]|uniref:histidine kinase n=1 Tax=Conexibacter stalactiti TaxID=1940611 RepID=A0ABU4HXG1_9ACTN|nr:sensor histidine kinase [Conexibacter stalactiti]MDW5597155.1 sensor histidine kinase [Conexibacter stalactiti]MEC5037797.1 sensor histidine kinase [Conexibacter stalactiti]
MDPRPKTARREAIRAGLLLGWLSVAAVLVAVALDVGARHPELVVALALAGAVANLGMGVLPWKQLLGPAGDAIRLNLWAGGLLVFVATLIVVGGGEARFDLLLFLVLPFIALTHEGRVLALWLALAAISFAIAMTLAPDPLSAAEVALDALLLSASVLLALALARATRVNAAAAARAAAAAELEQALLAESHHRIKNSLQTVADLLLLGRPTDAGESADAFDATAARIRSIAAVHHLLAGERGGTVASDRLLKTVVEALAAPGEEVVVVSDELRLEAARAQQLGVIANELIANALRHGRAPVTVVLAAGGAPDGEVRLEVRDAGRSGLGANGGAASARGAAPANGASSGLGLTLVRQIAERGLGGDFDLSTQPDGTTSAVLRFNVGDADPDR